MSVQQLVDLMRRLGLHPTEEDVLDALLLAPLITPQASVPRQDAGPEGHPPSPAPPPPPASKPPPAKPAAAERFPQAEDRDALHLGGAIGNRQAAAVRVPAAAALGDKLGMARALRPLKKRTPSHHLRYLDEEATANEIAIAEGRLWVPALRPVPARWLELAVVIDGYESMSIWRQLVNELRGVLEGLGAFSDVRFWVLDCVGADPAQPVLRRWNPGSPPRSVGELTDPAGRRAIMVVSDCLGPLWRTGAAQRQLAEWGTTQPVAIMQPLPQRLWAFTHAPPVPVTLRASRAGAPNAQLAVGGGARAAYERAIPVPVLEFEVDWLAAWSRMVGAVGTAGVPAMTVFANKAGSLLPGRAAEPDDPSPPDAMRLVRRFRASASPEAFQLAVYLTAAPISLPVIRVIQKTMLGTTRQSQVAEVFLGGLLRRKELAAADPDSVQYEFVTPRVRDILLRRLRRTEALRVLLTVSEFMDVRFGQARDFPAVLAGQSVTGDYLIGPDSVPFALVAERVLRLLGGQYLAPADRLATALGYREPRAGAVVPDKLAEPEAPAEATAPVETGMRALRRSKERPLVCPYCYHAFADRDILFRCSGRTDIYGSACEPRRDEVLEEQMGQGQVVNLLPPVFRPGKGMDEAACPWCQQRTRIQVCPRCHSRLPASFRSVEGRLIALAGPSLSGKTAYMTVLVHELRHQVGERLNATTIGADEKTHERFVQEFESQLYRKSLLFARTTTSGQDYIQPLVFRFTMDQRTRLRRRLRELLLSFADGAGEDLISDLKVELMTRYLAAADGVITLIDPLQLPVVRDLLGSAIALPPVLPPDQILAFERITRLLLEGSGGAVIDKPVAIVLTKVDTLWGLLPPDSMLRAKPEVEPFFDASDNAALQAEVTDVLTRWGGGRLIDIAREKYTCSRFFAVSSLGAQPTGNNRVGPAGIHPYRVIDPFMWLLSQFSFIETVRRD
jgi:hypothetical protein